MLLSFSERKNHYEQDKYDFIGLIGLFIYPLVLFLLAGLSFWDSLKRLRVVLPLICVVGVFNPFFDRTPVEVLGFHLNTGII